MMWNKKTIRLTQRLKIVIRLVRENEYKKLSNLLLQYIKKNMKESILYYFWIRKNEKNLKIKSCDFTHQPVISILVPVYNVKAIYLEECIKSVFCQKYKNWELCLVDDASTWNDVKGVLEKYEKYNRIKVIYMDENGHISRATNKALDIASGEFCAMLDCDDTLSEYALYEVVKKINEDNSVDYIYSDEDKISQRGKRHTPFFKPDWSPDTFMSMMYTCHLSVVRTSLLRDLGGWRVGFEGAQDYDLILRLMEKTNKILHLPKILYHWRETETSTSVSTATKPYAKEASIRALQESLERRGVCGKVEKTPYYFKVQYKAVGNPLVSIIIPSKDNYKMLFQCINSIRTITNYENYEIICIDNGSCLDQKKKYEELCNKFGCKYIYEERSFNFSYMCNRGTEVAKGSYYLFINDDIQVLQTEWLNRLVGHAMQKHAGAIGAKLLYPDTRRIQHVGVINLTVGPSHAFAGCNDDFSYYFGRNKEIYNYIAVTGACLMINREKFNEIGGFDESFPVAYNDVDLCFQLIKRGYYNVVRNDVELYHYESYSRKSDLLNKKKMERLKNELYHLNEKHKEFVSYDPFYSINLSSYRTDFKII